MKIALEETKAFQKWVEGLRDKKARAHVLRRIIAAKNGNFGDCEPVGEGVSEMRIHYGPGYRVYFGRLGETLYILLAGGDKSTQRRDIESAKIAWREKQGEKNA